MRHKAWIATVLFVGACATAAPPPSNLLVESRAAVRVAEQQGAQRDPQAAQYLVLARQQIADAQRLINEGSHSSANRMLEKAQLNAELAGEYARQAAARAEAVQTKREIDELKGRVP